MSDAGADGQASKVFTLVVNSAASGLTDAVTNEAITLTLDGTGTLITGSVRDGRDGVYDHGGGRRLGDGEPVPCG